jgi:mono/diheme cytochrome c family protein
MITRSAALLLAILTTSLAAEVRDLKTFYLERCAICHGPDGSGRDANGLRLGGRNLTDVRWLAKQEEPNLVASILRGRGAMPGFRRQLSEAEGHRMVVDIIHSLATRKRSRPPLGPVDKAP